MAVFTDVHPLESRSTLAASGVVFAAWAAVVAIAVYFHEPWRDEVRALSLATDAPTVGSLLRALHGEGHPALWYLMLRAAHDVFSSNLVLPAVSLAVAAAAVALFVFSGPFPLWFKALFVFSGIPLYEYSVMARNYGISMLLMFAFAAAYARPNRHPMLLGGILALLAQTNVHSAMLVPLFAFVWLTDWLLERPGASAAESAPRRRAVSAPWLAAGIVLAAAGVVAAFATVYPPTQNLMTRFVHRVSMSYAAIQAVLHPGQFYRDVAHPPGMPAAAQTVLLYAAIVGLAARPALLLSGLGALWGMSLFFVLVYPASGYRHQAILVVFLLSLYWVMLGRRSAGKVPHASVTVSDAGNAAAFSPIRRRGGRRVITDLFTLSFHAALPILLLINCVVGVRLLSQDFQGPATSAAALGEALRGATELAAAIVIPEPDHIAEALPYYADNAIYLLRERRFGKFSTWPKDSIRELSLGDLLAEARSLHARSGRPVVVVLQWPLSPDLVGEVFDDSGLGWHFSYSAADLAAFSRAAQEIDLGRPGFYESFHAYLVR